MAKVITRNEVNAMKSGTFTTDLNKAVLYGELSGNPDFVVSAENSVSHTNYTTNQALLDADIRVSAEITVTLTPRQSTIGASTTSVIFDITTAGTASVGTPVYSVVTATYDGGAPTSAVINGTQLTMTFPANTDYTSKEITARVKLTIDGREFESNLATVTQSRVEVTPSLSISYSGSAVSPASGNTNAFTITANYVTVTGYTVTSPATVGATGATSVTINYPANQTESTRTFTVTVRGRDVYGTERTNTCTFTQSSDAYTFSLTPSSSTAEFTDTSKTLTINKSNVNNVGVCAHTNTTSETISGNNLILGFNINHETYERSITVALSGTTAGGRAVSCNATITQSGASGLNLSISYIGQTLPASAGTTNEFSISAGESVTVTGYSVDVAGASMSNTGQTQATLNFPANQTDSTVTYTVTVYATTPTGTTSATTTVTQAADSYEFALSAITNPIDAGSTTAQFRLTGTSINNIGYVAAQSSNVGGISGLSSNAVTATGITPNTSQTTKTIKLVLSGVTIGGRTVYATGTTTQRADTYTFALAPVTNPIAASATTAAFNLTGTNITNIGYYAAQSSNITGISGLSSNSVTATGITGNSGSTDKQIKLVLSGKTTGGATVYATGTTVQSHSRSKFYFENDKSVVWDATSVTISFTYAYSSLGSINFTSTGGAFFNQQHSQSNIGVNIDAMSPQTSGSITIYFDQNTSNDNKTYTISATGFYGEAGEAITDELEITHMSFAGASLTLDVNGSDTAPWNGGTINLRGTYTNINENTLGKHSSSSSVPTYGTITKGSGSYNFSITVPSHTGAARDFTIIVSATTLASTTITASTVVHQAAGVVTHDLIVTAASTSVAYNGTTQLTATYKTYVNGVETDSQNVTNSTTWSDDSSYASVSSAGVFTANNTTYNSVSVTVTGTYSGQSDTVAITVGASPYPAGSIDVQARDDWHLDGDAGSDYFTVKWTGLKTGTSITLSTTAITSTNPTSISVTSVNGSATVNFNYSALSSGARKLVLEATGTDRNNTSRRDSDYYVQHGVGGSSGSSLSVSAVTSSPVGPDVTSVTFRVTWSDVYGTITLTPSIGTASPTSITANGSNSRDITVTMGANTGSSSRTITLTGATDFNHLSGNASIVQNAHVITHALIVTAASSSISYNGTVQLTATYNTYTDGTLTDSEDVTNSTTWTDNSQYASISNSGLLTANNTTSSSITVRATGTYSSLSDYVDITIGAYVPSYDPDIWWTKTNGGGKNTEVTSINDVPAFVAGTYTGQDVIYTIYINYVDISSASVSLDTSSLTNGATASISGKVVTITVPVNKTLSTRSLGSLTVTGTAPDSSSSDSATLSITQEAGVNPSMSFTLSPQTVGATITSVTDTLTYNYVDPNSLGVSGRSGNITNVQLS